MSSAIVKVDKRPYRVIAQENWGLTDEQMKGMHVHHRIALSQGGTNDASNLFVCSPWYHFNMWHGPESRLAIIEHASRGGKIGGKKGKGKTPWNKGLKTGPNPGVSKARKGSKGKPLSQKHKDAISKANKGRKRPDASKRMSQYNRDNNKFRPQNTKQCTNTE